MHIVNTGEVEERKIETFPYKGKPYAVRDVRIRWLTQAGPPESPEYGLRFFTVGPGGEIPIHNHFYIQSMYILGGSLSVASHDPETDEKTTERRVGPGDVIFIPSMEPHSLKNGSDQESATFLCCIANVYEDEDA